MTQFVSVDPGRPENFLCGPRVKKFEYPWYNYVLSSNTKFKPEVGSEPHRSRFNISVRISIFHKLHIQSSKVCCHFTI
jgi:hypothetical protein